jgi:hypothetical protein
MTGKFPETKGGVALDPKVAVFELRVGPCQFERSIAHVGVTVLTNQPHQLVARISRDGDKHEPVSVAVARA